MVIKSLKRYTIFSNFGRLNLNIKNFNVMLSVKARPSLRNLFIRLGYLVGVRLQRSNIGGVILMVNRIVYLYKRMGPNGTVKYLKATAVILQQYLGDYQIADTAKVGKMRISRNNRGLPRLIPVVLRRAIRNDNFAIIRWVFTILNCYRVINFPGTPDLRTIAQPFKGPETDIVLVDPKGQATVKRSLVTVISLLKPYIRPFILALPLKGFAFTKEAFRKANKPLFIIWKAGPGMIKLPSLGLGGISNYSTHPINLVMSLRALKGSPVWGQLLHLADRFSVHQVTKLVNIAESTGILEGPFKAVIGKLHAKEEAAGKVRIFAIVDAWTQWVLHPLHKAIFQILRRIPQDGTFDQPLPLKSLDLSKGAYSLDLTAATDRLPLGLQVEILAELLEDRDAATSWASLLVGRVYKFFQLGYSKYHGVYSYAVGQPMGALSSWAMLALTHHFLVQVSAWRCGFCPVGTWYRNYAVLGDDLVIGDKAVADEYLKLLSELGMDVNIHKSILSPTGNAIEFAKRTIYKGVNVSPVALKDVASARSLLPALVQFMRIHEVPLPRLLAGFGFGWRTLSWLSKPLGKLSAQVRAILLAVNIPATMEESEGFFALGTPKFVKYIPNPYVLNLKFIQAELLGARIKLENRLNFVQKFRFGELVETPAGVMTMGNADTMPKAWCEDLFMVTGELLIDKWEAHSSEFVRDLSLVDLKIKTVPSGVKNMIKSYTALSVTDFYKFEPFFFEIWRYVHNQALSNYQSDVQKVLLKFDDWTDLFGDAVRNALKRPFFELYWTYVQFLHEIALLGEHIFHFEKPEGSEVLSKSMNSVTPQQIRFYRAWSGVLQGSMPLDALQLEFKSKKKPVHFVPINDGLDSTGE